MRRNASCSGGGVSPLRCGLMIVQLGRWSNDRSATCEMNAVGAILPVWPRRSDYRWNHSLRSRRSPCTRIRRHSPLHSCRCKDGQRWSTGRCRGRTWWTSCCGDNWRHHDRRYPNTLTREGYSWSVPTALERYCTQRSTSWDWHVPAGQISAWSGVSMSADEVVRCRASNCLWSRWIQL